MHPRLHRLIPHPDTPPKAVATVTVEIATSVGDDVRLVFSVTPAGSVQLPRAATPARTNGLWRTTCFELFVETEDGAYLEFNFSPSSQWAAYAFDSYRAGMRDFDFPGPPEIVAERNSDALIVRADVDLCGSLMARQRIALSAVIEEVDGTKSYWALKHAPGAPDFHHPDCFALELPAPELP